MTNTREEVALLSMLEKDYAAYECQWSDSEMPITDAEKHAYYAGYKDGSQYVPMLVEALKFYAVDVLAPENINAPIMYTRLAEAHLIAQEALNSLPEELRG